MKKQVLMLVTAAFILAFGALAASAQQSPGTPTLRQPDQAQRADEQNPGTNEQEGVMGRGMMGRGMMGRGMMGCGIMGHAMMAHAMMGRRAMMGPVAMRIIFALMDADGDGTVSLQEFQAAHERIFKAMDADKDGSLTLEEMQAFMRGE